MSNENHVSPREIVSHINKAESVLPLGIQADLLGISRYSLYYQPKPVDSGTLAIMHSIDELYTKRPFYGSRRIAKDLAINRKQAQRLMRLMGIEAIYQKPNLSKPHPDHRIYPYLLRGVTAIHPNHIWGTDITYIRMKHGFLYLTAYLDWFSRFVLSWRLSTTLEIAFCLEAAEEALQLYNAPEIENSDQGSHYTSDRHIELFTVEQRSVWTEEDGQWIISLPRDFGEASNMRRSI